MGVESESPTPVVPPVGMWHIGADVPQTPLHFRYIPRPASHTCPHMAHALLRLKCFTPHNTGADKASLAQLQQRVRQEAVVAHTPIEGEGGGGGWAGGGAGGRAGGGCGGGPGSGGAAPSPGLPN